MDLIGLVLIGVVLVFGSIYAAWTTWTVWREVRANVQKTKASAGAGPTTTRLQQGVTLLVSLAFFSVALSLCFSIAQGESFSEALGQLRSLTAQQSSDIGVTWGDEGNQGTLHVSRTLDGQRVTGASLAYLRFGDSDLKKLVERYPHIQWFILSGTQVDDRGLEILAQQENLNALVVADTSITDRGLAALQGQRELHELDLTQTAITDLTVVASMPTLERLSLRLTSVTDSGLRVLEGNESLHTLNIQRTSISDGSIATLATFRNLRNLYTGGSRLSPDGLARLRRALPECQVTPESSPQPAQETELDSVALGR